MVQLEPIRTGQPRAANAAHPRFPTVRRRAGIRRGRFASLRDGWRPTSTESGRESPVSRQLSGNGRIAKKPRLAVSRQLQVNRRSGQFRSPARTKDHLMTVSARARLAAAGVLLVALAVAACSAASGTPSAARTTATAREQRLLVDTAPGYSANVSATPGYIVRYAYSHESSCQRGPASPGASGRPVLTLHARWTDDKDVIQLHRVTAAFNETTGFLIDPFMIFWLSPPRGASSSSGTQPRWATSTAEGNSVTGYHGTGWVNVSASAPVIDGAAPSPPSATVGP